MIGLLGTAPAIETAPFAHVLCRSALPEPDYRRLAEAFPPLAAIAGPPPYPGNRAFSVRADIALRSPRLAVVWREFIAEHVSAGFWRRIAGRFGAQFRTTYPGLEARIGRPFDQWRVGCRHRDRDGDVLLDCQLVLNTPVTKPGTVRGPHVDACDKLFAGLFYFRPDDDPTPGGDLELYRWRGAPRFDRMHAPPEAIEHVRTVAYAANTFLGFVNSPMSVHGVAPRPRTGHARFYVNIFAVVPFDLFAAPGTVPGRNHEPTPAGP